MPDRKAAFSRPCLNRRYTGQEPDGHRAAQGGVVCEIHLAHSTHAEQCADFISSQSCSGREMHGGDASQSSHIALTVRGPDWLYPRCRLHAGLALTAASTELAVRLGASDRQSGDRPEPVERGVDAEKLQLQVARGERLFQRFERLLALAQCDVENSQLARRDVVLARLQSFQDRLRLLPVACIRMSGT